MTAAKDRKAVKDTAPETVEVEVVVSHDDLRAGERGTVELTDTVRRRLDKGYLQIADPAETADDEDNLTVRPLGSTARQVEPGGVLLGVEVPPAAAVPVGSGAGSGGAGTAAV